MTNLALTIPMVAVSKNFVMYPIVPSDAAQGWKLELFESRQIVPTHYHKIKRQYVLITEGYLEVLSGREKPLMMEKGVIICFDPGMVHTLIPRESVQFLVIDLPEFEFPNDVYLEEVAEPEPWIPTPVTPAPFLDSKYFPAPTDHGDYSVYDLIIGQHTDEKWSIALLEIQNSPRHLHKIELEHFIVVQGTLAIEVDGETKVLSFGEMITIHPGSVHQLKSANHENVRVLCFSFPAFDQEDFYPQDSNLSIAH